MYQLKVRQSGTSCCFLRRAKNSLKPRFSRRCGYDGAGLGAGCSVRSISARPPGNAFRTERVKIRFSFKHARLLEIPYDRSLSSASSYLTRSILAFE